MGVETVVPAAAPAGVVVLAASEDGREEGAIQAERGAMEADAVGVEAQEATEC